MSGFNWEDYEEVKPQSFDWEKHKEVKPESTLKELGESTMQNLPGLGMMAGGAMAGVPGAMAGGYAGSAVKNLYNKYNNPELAPQSEQEYLTDPMLHGMEGAALEGIGNAAGKALSPVGKFIKNKIQSGADSMKSGAERLAFRALGPFKRQVNQNKDRIHEIGRTALDEGVIKLPPGSAETIEKRAQDASSQAGQHLGQIVDEILKLEKQTKGRFSTGSVKRLADYLRQELIVPNTKVPGIQRQNEYFENLIKELTGNNKTLNFEQMRKMKLDTNGMINWNRLKNADIPLEEQFYRKLYSALRQGEEYGAEALEKAYYAQSSKKFADAKKRYGNLEEAAEIAGNRADAQRANQILGLKSAVYGAAGAGIGGEIGHKAGGVPGAIIGSAIGGGVGSIGNHLAKNYGSQFSAVVLDKAAKLLAKSPSLLNTSEKYPNFLPFLLQSLENKSKQEHGK